MGETQIMHFHRKWPNSYLFVHLTLICFPAFMCADIALTCLHVRWCLQMSVCFCVCVYVFVCVCGKKVCVFALLLRTLPMDFISNQRPCLAVMVSWSCGQWAVMVSWSCDQWAVMSRPPRAGLVTVDFMVCCSVPPTSQGK